MRTPRPLSLPAAFLIAASLTLLAAAEPRTGPPLLRSARSGPWSAAATWEGGQVPAAGARVQIRTGHRVVYDVRSEAVLRSVHVAGVLTFARDRDTRLDVGLIKIQAGTDASEEGFDCEAHLQAPTPGQPRPALEVGTPSQPVEAGHTALIRLTYVDGLDRKSCPAIVCCGGRLDLHGAPLGRTWIKLGATARKGDAAVTLAGPVIGWRSGDRVILTSTQHEYRTKGLLTEERIVRSIDGAKLTLDRPLEREHLGEGKYRGEVANLSRNVIVESADPTGERGHTMYHKYSAGAISYAEFRHLGKTGVLGRYSLHYHLCGDTMRGSYVIGASIWDSGNRWLTIHGTNDLVVRDCVGYRSIGHGFFLEDGTEVRNVLDRNLAVAARRGRKLPGQLLPFDQNEGAGYWWANSLNTFTDNVAVECGQYGFRYEATASRSFSLTLPVQQADGSRKLVDVRTLPFVRFEGNEVHGTTGLYGFNLGEGVGRVGPDSRHPFIVRRMKIWDVHYAFRPQAPSLLVEDMEIHRAAYGVYHPHYDNHVYHNLLISETNTEPFNRGHDDLSAQYGVLVVDGLTFAGIRSGESMPLIQISDDNPSGRAASHFRNVRLVDWKGSKRRALVNRGGGPRPKPKTPKAVPVYLHDWFGPGRTARVLSTQAHELKDDGLSYREEPLLTGDESRVAEVHGVAFPQPLDPVDDFPPSTVITHVTRTGGKWLIRGTASDNGTIRRVVVNGREARPLRADWREWEVTLAQPAAGKIAAHAEDGAGNVEKRPHVVAVGAR